MTALLNPVLSPLGGLVCACVVVAVEVCVQMQICQQETSRLSEGRSLPTVGEKVCPIKFGFTFNRTRHDPISTTHFFSTDSIRPITLEKATNKDLKAFFFII